MVNLWEVKQLKLTFRPFCPKMSTFGPKLDFRSDIGKLGSRNPNMGSLATPYLQVVKESRDLVLKFWDPSYISGMELEISNLACRLTTRGDNKKN